MSHGDVHLWMHGLDTNLKHRAYSHFFYSRHRIISVRLIRSRLAFRKRHGSTWHTKARNFLAIRIIGRNR